MARTMLHSMESGSDPTSMNREMNKYNLNLVLAYGLYRNLTLIVKQPMVHKKMLMNGETTKNTGLGELTFRTKYGIYRRNTPEYNIGIAAIAGLKFPTGAYTFSSKTWDIKSGLYLSLRASHLASDFNIGYSYNGSAKKTDGTIDFGDEFELDWALAYQFVISDDAETVVAPVLEFSYKYIAKDQMDGADLPDSGESVLYLSPGVKLTKSAVKFEILFQIPIWQIQKGSQLQRNTGVIAGIRYLF